MVGFLDFTIKAGELFELELEKRFDEELRVFDFFNHE
jgi:hypothetical protein